MSVTLGKGWKKHSCSALKYFGKSKSPDTKKV